MEGGTGRGRTPRQGNLGVAGGERAEGELLRTFVH